MNPAYDGVIATGAWPFVISAYAATALALTLYAVRVVRLARRPTPSAQSREHA
jgi:hypothetical protein